LSDDRRKYTPFRPTILLPVAILCLINPCRFARRFAVGSCRHVFWQRCSLGLLIFADARTSRSGRGNSLPIGLRLGLRGTRIASWNALHRAAGGPVLVTMRQPDGNGALHVRLGNYPAGSLGASAGANVADRRRRRWKAGALAGALAATLGLPLGWQLPTVSAVLMVAMWYATRYLSEAALRSTVTASPVAEPVLDGSPLLTSQTTPVVEVKGRPSPGWKWCLASSFLRPPLGKVRPTTGSP
jgi:hypothetical protein